MEMLADLENARAEAAEEGYPAPSDLAIANAKRVLTDTRRFSTRRFEVYPTPDGEIAIDAPNGGGSALLLLDSDGGALCLVNLNGDQRQKRYDSADELPDEFLAQALARWRIPKGRAARDGGLASGAHSSKSPIATRARHAALPPGIQRPTSTAS